jgi:membrane fusion protein, multidrug efflux system
MGNAMNLHFHAAAGASFVAAALLAACTHGGAADDEAHPSPATGNADATAASVQVPVRVDAVRREMIDVTVTAPGRTEALRQDRIRAPFASRVLSLRVADGDQVHQGQILAVVVSKNSAAALAGAEQMLAAAHTDGDIADAKRAVELARGERVQQALRARAAGVVVSHSAEAGDYADESEVLLTVAEAGAVFFNAQVAQSDVGRVHTGQAAHIDLPAVGARPVEAIVHGSLPVASSQNFSAPVRLDFPSAGPQPALGLFGEASIVVARHADANIVPVSAVLRDDISGVTRIAIVESGSARWLTVDTGIRQGDRVEILRPIIEPGTRVIVQGQVGLPQGARVAVRP